MHIFVSTVHVQFSPRHPAHKLSVDVRLGATLREVELTQEKLGPIMQKRSRIHVNLQLHPKRDHPDYLESNK